MAGSVVGRMPSAVSYMGWAKGMVMLRRRKEEVNCGLDLMICALGACSDMQ